MNIFVHCFTSYIRGEDMKRWISFLLILLLLPVIPAKAQTIKWVDFQVPYESLKYAMDMDIATFEQEKHISMVDILSLAACRTGGKCGLVSVKKAVTDLKGDKGPEELLDGIPSTGRDAEWHFLKGSVCYSKGWLDQAHQYFAQAVRMNPSHPEYNAAYQQTSRMRHTGTANNYGGYRTVQTGGGMDGCDLCSTLICADCCCECMGGDLIACC